jgi:hypothetical protein
MRISIEKDCISVEHYFRKEEGKRLFFRGSEFLDSEKVFVKMNRF